MALPEYLEAGSEWAETDGWDGVAWYAVDENGIVAGPFDDEGEALWWLEKSARVA